MIGRIVRFRSRVGRIVRILGDRVLIQYGDNPEDTDLARLDEIALS